MTAMKTVRTLLLAAVVALLLVGARGATSPHGPSAAMAKTTAPAISSAASKAPADDELAYAQEVLADLQSTYRLLDGVTITMGDTPGDHQAVSYYAEGRIIINPSHAASIGKIVSHEIWHIIDYRDNGRLDWGEDVPPYNAQSYLK